jgi:hypothetical protein
MNRYSWWRASLYKEIIMAERVYTLGQWRVREGKEGEFIVGWRNLGKTFSELAMPPGEKGTLVQSLNEPLLFYSFGEWPSIEAVQAMRQDPRARDAIDGLRELCDEAIPGSFRVVAEV